MTDPLSGSPAPETPQADRVLTPEQCFTASSIVADAAQNNENGLEFQGQCSVIARVLGLAANRQGLARPLPSETQEVEKEALIEKHARFAVLEVQHQNNSYQPTPYEANALKNHRHILRRFADELSALLAAPARQPTEEKDLSRVDRQPTSERRPTASRD